jgi:hypothetical protein
VAELQHERVVVAWCLMLLMLGSCAVSSTQTRLVAFAMNFLPTNDDLLRTKEVRLTRLHLTEVLYAESTGIHWHVPIEPSILVSGLAPFLGGCFNSKPPLSTFLDNVVQEFLAHFAQTTVSRPVFVDIGSNTACASLLVVALNPALHVHAFDPVPSNCEAVIQSFALNNLTDRAVFSCIGLHHQVMDEVPLRIPAPDGGLGQGMSTFCSDPKVLTNDNISVGECHRARRSRPSLRDGAFCR